MNYQEQYQLFLWTWDYLLERLSVPGGFADYLSELLVQFYYLPPLGAVIFVLLLAALGWATRSALAPAAMLVYLTNPNVMLSFLVGLIAVCSICRLVDSRANKRASSWWQVSLFWALIIPLCYWLFGIAVYVFALYACARALINKKMFARVAIAIYVPLIVWLSTLYLPYPPYRLWTGLHYFRYVVGTPYWQWVVIALTIPFYFLKIKRLWFWILNAVFVLCSLVWSWKLIDTDLTEHIEYDYFVRTEQWNKIISKAEKKNPQTPMTVAALNMALSETGVLLDRMFDFYQNHSDGLIPAFTKDIISPITTAEIYFRLSMPNDCERFCFETLMMTPDHQLSGRLIKRIAQCEIINGQYQVAEKYLKLLTHSTFYAKGAKSHLEMIKHPERIEDVQPYKTIRQNREKLQRYFSVEEEAGQMCGLVLLNNRTNRTAYEYLIAWQLLNCKIEKFMEYYSMGRYIDYKRIPTNIQQMLVGQWLLHHSSLEGMPYSSDKFAVDNTVNFVKIYSANKNDPRLKEYPYKNNVWSYLLVN